MDEQIRQALADEISNQLNGLSDLQLGSKEQQTAVENVTKLYRLGLEVEQMKDRYFKLGIEVAGIVLPLIFYATWMKRGFKFEETGTYTSTTFRGLFNRFRPTKK